MASYAVSGWVALEVVGALVERDILTELLYRVGLVVFLGGAVASAILGWYHGEKGHQQATRFEMVLLTLTVLVTGFFSVQTVRGYPGTDPVLVGGRFPLDRVAVLYFTDRSRDGSLSYLAEGLTESLIDRLDVVNGLDVVSRSGSLRFRDATIPRDSIATILRAGTLVEGALEPRGDRIRLRLALYDEEGTETFSETFDRDGDDIFALQDDLSEEVSGLLRRHIGEEINLQRARRGTEDMQAWVSYQRGQAARQDAESFIRRGDVQGFIANWTRADSLYREAEDRDPAWPEPTTARAILASRWGELSAAEEPEEGRAYMLRSIALTDTALAKDPRNAQARFVRGTVNFQVWVMGLAATPDAGGRAFDQAQADLEEATRLDPTLAQAWSTLSILYSQIPDPVGANLAARRAWEEDEYLRSADSVLRRLYQTSYDLQQFREAITYCQQGRERFPEQPDFTQCILWLQGAPGALPPQPDRVWDVVDEHLALVPEEDREYERVKDHLLAAQVLARAGLADSARAVARRSQASPDVNPSRDLLGIEALVHLALGDLDTAVDRLRIYLTASPEHRAGWQWSSHWWWQPLRDHAGFRRVIGG